MAFLNGQEIIFSPKITGLSAIIHCEEALPTTDIDTAILYEFEGNLYWYDEEWHKLGEGECEVTSAELDEIREESEILNGMVNDLNADMANLTNRLVDLEKNGSGDIVVPAQGSRGNANFVESVAGLVKLYNESAGLGLDEYGQLGIAAATTTDIDKEESLRKPIVPKTMRYAMGRYSYKAPLLEGLYDSDEDAYTPIAAITVKDFVLKYALNFKLYKIPRGEMFEVKPGMIALVLPYGDYTLSLHESETADAKVSNMGATVVMATDWGADAEDGNCFWVACMSAKSYKVLGAEIPTMGSNHTKYTSNCYIKNNDTGTSGTGYAYVYYISRGEE